MPNCFMLTKKGGSGPTPFATIDDELRKHLNQPADPKKFLYTWYDVIGLGISMGKDFDYLRKEICFDSPELLSVIDFLEEHYVPSAWYQAR